MSCLCVCLCLCSCLVPVSIHVSAVGSRLLIYGDYCSRMEHAQKTLNQLLANRDDVRQKVEVGLFQPCTKWGPWSFACGLS